MSQMTKSEARDLKALVRSEYLVLNKEVDRRARQLEDEAKDWYEKQQLDAAELLAPYQDEAEKLFKTLKSDLKALAARIKKETGLKYTSNYTFESGMSANNLPWNRFETTKVGTAGYRSMYDQINVQRWEIIRSLERQEQDMIRDLTLQTLESEDAVDFFHNIPTAEELLPRPAAMKVIDAGD